MKLRGKKVLITGAAQRIGRQIALTLARRGATILIHYNRSGREAQKLQAEIQEMGEEAFLFKANFSASKSSLHSRIRKFAEDLQKEVGGVDVLINNASVFYPTPFGKVKEKDWEDMLSINLKAPFFLAQELGAQMTKQKSGKIINLIDSSVDRPRSGYLPYTISKAGLDAATQGLAKALAPHVQVLSVAPGPILPAKGSSKKEQKAILEKTLLKRWGHPEDVANTIRFLIEGTDFITGAFLPVDGGAHLV